MDGALRKQHAPPQRGAARRGGGHHPAHVRDHRARRPARGPAGWLGSGLQETWNTPDLLAAEGCEYVCDWTNDDQPYVMNLDGGRRLVSMPYSHEINDKPVFEKFHRTADEFHDMICRQFDVLYREGAESGRVMAIALHPYLTGVPHRIDAFDAALGYICSHERVWKATGERDRAALSRAVGQAMKEQIMRKGRSACVLAGRRIADRDSASRPRPSPRRPRP